MPNHYALFVLAVSLLIVTPGPNVALIVANSVAHGVRYGLLTVAGTSAAIVGHMLLVGFGMGEGLGAIGALLEWVRWVGVAYLVVLGVQAWRAPATDLRTVAADRRPRGAVVARAFLVSLTNPKVLLFYGAFFPQFIAADRPVAPQLWVLCATYLGVAVVFDVLWVLAASRARVLIAAHVRLRNRISGGLLIGAGVGLALARPK